MSELLAFLTTQEAQFRRTRLAALYSDFRHLQTLNPDGYTANVEAWRKGLSSATKAGKIPNRGSDSDRLVLTLDEEILRALEHPEWGRPLALGTVVRDAVVKKKMMFLADFLRVKDSIYTTRWVETVSPWAVLSWGLRQLGLAGGKRGEDTLPVGEVVVLSNVEDAAKAVASRMSGLTSRTEMIYSKRLFYKEFANVMGEGHTLSKIDIDVLLTYISRDIHLADYDGETVKLGRLINSPKSRITTEDSTVAALKTLMVDLDIQVGALTSRVDALTVTAREALTRKNRLAAISALKSKKLAERNLEKQSATLNQLEEIYSKIGQASDQVELIRIIEGSTGVLKSLNAEIGGVERVDDVVGQLREEMVHVDEIGCTINELGDASAINELEVDEELDAMERVEKEKREAIERKVKEQEERNAAELTRKKLEELEISEKDGTERQEGLARKTIEEGTAHEAIRENYSRTGQIPLDELRATEPAI